MEYVMYCDESSDKGSKYVDFFGGCIVDGRYVEEITAELDAKKKALNMFGEIKWTKVTGNYLDKYIEIINLFFSYIKDGKIKVRIMFRRKDNIQTVISTADDKYFKLYYQFIKHAFGLRYIPSDQPAYVRIYLDKLPDTIERCNKFKNFLFQMQDTAMFKDSGLLIRKEDIAEIDSKKHSIQQCLDIILGSMQFRLNELNKVKSPTTQRRGKKTIAKEKLYNEINRNIRDIHPNFNIGISTGAHGQTTPHLTSPYEHWLFVSRDVNSDYLEKHEF